MADLGKLWAGRAFGTNTGNLFVQFTQTTPEITGELRLLDERFGPCVYQLRGTFDTELVLTGSWASGGEADTHGELTIQGALTEEGNIRGTWISTIGTGGTFALYPHDFAPTREQGTSAGVPEQLFTRSMEVGAVRLYAKDVTDLIRFVGEDFTAARVVVSYRLRGSEVNRYANQFLAEIGQTQTLDYIKINIQEVEAHGINRVVTVELSANGTNTVRAQGIRESWVIGRAQALAEYLKRFESPVVTNFKKHGLNLNSVILIAMLIAIPEIATLGARAAFVVIIVSLVLVLAWLHRKLIPNAAIVLGSAEPSALERIVPTLVSWFGAVAATAVGSGIFWWFTKP